MGVNGSCEIDFAPRNKDPLDAIPYFLGYHLLVQTRLHQACVASRFSDGKASTMEDIPRLVTVNQPLSLPCRCARPGAAVEASRCNFHCVTRQATIMRTNCYLLCGRSCGRYPSESTFTCAELWLQMLVRAALHTHGHLASRHSLHEAKARCNMLLFTCHWHVPVTWAYVS